MPDFPGWYFALRRINVVDTFGPNLLMRTSNPTVYNINGPFFSRSSLTEALKGAAGSLFPEGDVELIDVTLLGEKEQRVIDAEQRGFGSDLVHWPFLGVTPEVFAGACKSRGLSCPDSMQPGELAAGARKRLAADFGSWDADELDDKVERLRTLLEGPGKDGAPRVIFFHCLCGCDRTGELFAAYSMRYRNMTLTQAIAENELVAGRHQYYHFQVAAQWYCESLRERGLYAHGDCGNCGPFRCRDTGVPLDPIFPYIFVCLVAVLTTGLLAMACWYCSARRRKQQDEDQFGYRNFVAA